MKSLPLLITWIGTLFLAACSAQTPAVQLPSAMPAALLTPAGAGTPMGAGSPSPNPASTTSAAPAIVATLTPSPRPTLNPTITVTATPLVSLYNRYIGKDEKRQPELIKTPLGAILPVTGAAAYPASYLATTWDGKQVNGDPIRGDAVMLDHLIQLFNDAARAGHRNETVLSSYRSYEEQVYLKQQDTAENDKYLAVPGRSEHQLGTAVDLAWGTERLNFNVMNVYPPARAFYNYLKENAQRFGFIFSYPFKSNANQSKTNILEPYVTEYKAEPWHLRYVGVELAEKISAARDEQGRNYLDPLSLLVPQQFMLP